MPAKEELVKCFQDTINIINSNNTLLNSTKDSIKNTRIIYDRVNHIHQSNDIEANITVVENTTFDAAKEYAYQGRKVAVLNFASAVNPGGGVSQGAMAQEECLCRSSNLLPCLKQKHLMKDYYMPHRIANHPMYSDKIIYTPNITVFKTDDALPVIMPENQWFNVDVITCAAPNLRNVNHFNEDDLLHILCNRIDLILNSALNLKVDTVILGAWGCGAFKNPPEIVAKAFKQVIDDKYKCAFENIIFGIKKSNNNNFSVFKQIFYSQKQSTNIDDFKKRQRDNKYYGKSFSVLGDSISTLAGYIPRGYKAFFEGDVCKTSGVNLPEDTWWGKVIAFFGGKLLANSSYSGSRVTSQDKSFPSGCSEKRINDLSIKGLSPDVIIIYLGFNDWANGVEVESDAAHSVPLPAYFDFAYRDMIKNIRDKYPNAEIICCTLNPTFMSKKQSFAFPYEEAGIHIKKYNEKIRAAARQYNCNLVDLYSYNTPNDTIDGSHPNADGMNTLASLICYSLSEDNGTQFIHLENCEFPIGDEKLECKGISEISEKKKFCYKCGEQMALDDKFCMKCGTKIVTITRMSDSEKESEEKATEIENDNDETDEIIDDRYKLIRQIGKGASAIVYLAQDIKLNRVCAMKIVKKNTYSNKMAAWESLDEVNKMKLLAHISIPQLYDIYDDDDRLCIVMEFIEGKNLNEIINSRKHPLDEYTVVSWAKQLCKVLFYLHTLKPPRIFRDLKPANIILQPNGIIKLIDFGTMKNYDESCTEDTVNLGTKGYAAPEQFGGRGQTDARTDIYGLGMTMYYLITGVNPSQPPFEFKPIKNYRKDISADLENLVMKCIEIERENRYQSAVDLLKDLEKLY